jgi:hypothetical protein
MICYCCCRQSSQKPSIELQKSFKPYLEAVKFNPNTSQANTNGSSLDALDVATLNPRYVLLFSTSPPEPTPLFPQCKHSYSNHRVAVTDNMPSTTTSRILTLPLEHPRRNNGTSGAPASPPQGWITTRRSTPSRTKCQATTPPLLVAQTPSTTHKQVTSILQDLVWA